MTSLPLGADRAKVSGAKSDFSVMALAGATATTGNASSSVMVTVALDADVSSLIPSGSDSCTTKVSSYSSSLSCVVCISMVLVLSPFLMVTVCSVVEAV